MALLNKLFPSRKKNQKQGYVQSEIESSWKPFNFNIEQVRVLLFRECDWRGRKLLFDSKAVLKIPLENQSSSRLRFGTRQKCDINKKNDSFVEVSNGFGYQYTRPNSDVTMMGEMIFGSVAMTFRGTTLKVHSMKVPSRLMCTKVFQSPINSHRHNGHFSDHSLEDSYGSSINSMSEYLNSQSSNSDSRLVGSGPLDVPACEMRAKTQSSSVEMDSGFCGDASLQSVSSGSSAGPWWNSFSTVPDSRRSSGPLGGCHSGGSLASLQRRWLRNMSTSLELGLEKGSSDPQDESHPQKRTKLGLAVIICLTPEQERAMQEFVFEHMTVVESMVERLRCSTEWAYSKKEIFVHLMMEGYHDLQQWLLDLFTSPRLPRPVWSGLTSKANGCNSTLASTFVQDMCHLVATTDTKATNFFMSTLLTAVLTHHLGWVNTVLPGKLCPHNISSETCAELKLDCLAKSHPYNPLWAQLGDLCGALGNPTKVARTIVTCGGEQQRKTDTVQRILSCLSYFVRCGEVEARDGIYQGGLQGSPVEPSDPGGEKRFGAELQILKDPNGHGQFPVQAIGGNFCSPAGAEWEDVEMEHRSPPRNVAGPTKSSGETQDASVLLRNHLPCKESPSVATTSIPCCFPLKDELKCSKLRPGQLPKRSSTKSLKSDDDPTSVDRPSFPFADTCKNGDGDLTTSAIDSPIPTSCDATEGVEYLKKLGGLKRTTSFMSKLGADSNENTRRKLYPNLADLVLAMDKTDSPAKLELSDVPEMTMLNRMPYVAKIQENFHIKKFDCERQQASIEVCIPSISKKELPAKYLCLNTQSELQAKTSVEGKSKEDVIFVLGDNDKLVGLKTVQKRSINVNQNILNSEGIGCERLRTRNCANVLSEIASQVPFLPNYNNYLSNKEDINIGDVEHFDETICQNINLKMLSCESLDVNGHPNRTDNPNGNVDVNLEGGPLNKVVTVRSDVIELENVSLRIHDKIYPGLEAGPRKLVIRSQSLTEARKPIGTLRLCRSRSDCGGRTLRYLKDYHSVRFHFERCSKVLTSYVDGTGQDEALQAGVNKMNEARVNFHFMDSDDCECETSLVDPVCNCCSDAKAKDKASGESTISTQEHCSKEAGTLLEDDYSSNNTLIESKILETIKEGPTKCHFDVSSLMELPLPSCLLEPSSARLSGFSASLFGGVSDHYIPDLVLQGCSQLARGWEASLRRDLTLVTHHPLLDQEVSEAVCIVANTDTWDVQLVSSHMYIVDKPGTFGVQVGMSQLVANMLESLLHLCKLKTPPEHCLLHLESKLRELCLRSQALAELLLTTEFCNMEFLTASLDLDPNDVPLLLAVASTHTPQVTQKYGLTFR